jgi:hypothetical protein
MESAFKSSQYDEPLRYLAFLGDTRDWPKPIEALTQLRLPKTIR